MTRSRVWWAPSGNSFFDRPFFSHIIFFLTFLLLSFAFFDSLPNLLETRRQESALRKFDFIDNSEIHFGDFPVGEQGFYEFKRFDSSLWKPFSQWPSQSELESEVDTPFLWFRIKTPDLTGLEERFFLIEHSGIAFQIYSEDGQVFFSYGSLEDPKGIPNLFSTEFSWIPLPEEPTEYIFIRTLHKKGRIFGIRKLTDSLGSKTAVFSLLAESNMLSMIFSSFFQLTGFICLLVYFIQFKKKYYTLLDFSVFSLLFGILGFLDNDFIQFLSSGSTWLVYLSIAVSNLVFIPMHSGLRRQFGDGKWAILKTLLILNSVMGSFNILFFFFFKESEAMSRYLVSFSSFLLFFAFLNILGPLIVSYFAWKKGTRGGFGHFVGFLITLGFVSYEILKVLKGHSGLENVIYWGVFFSVFTQGLELERSFFSNSLKIKEFEANLLKTEKSLKDAELKGLQSKMNPHYLFNSLNTIHALHKTKPDIVGDAILSLANNYRFFLDKSDKDLITLNEEWMFVEDYLLMQRMRFYDSVRVEIFKEDFPPSMLIPPLSLQPIIENCFKHGFIAMEDKNFNITIKGKWSQEGFYSISVLDNGKGIIDSTIDPNKDFMKRSLGNIKQRLIERLPGSDLQIFRSYPNGFKVEILLSLPR